MTEHTLDDSLPVHPRTGDRALGRRKDGRPIWPIRGGSGEGGDPATPPAPTGDPAPAPNPAAPRPPTPPPSSSSPKRPPAPSTPRPSATNYASPSMP